MIGVLKQRNYALLWVGQLISTMGDLILYIALPFYVYKLTGSALATAGMFIAESLPRLIGGSVAGVFVDRWNRKTIMIVSDLLRAGLMLIVLSVRSADLVWIVYVVTFVEASISIFFLPAKSAVIPLIVSRKDLGAANSLDAVSMSVTQLVGPSIGGALFGLFSITGVVFTDSASFLVSAACILFIAGNFVPKREVNVSGETRSALGSLWREWLDGLVLMVRERLLAVYLITVTLLSLGQGIINVLLLVFVRQELHGGSLQYGWMATAQGLGALVGGIALAQLVRNLDPARLFGAGLVIGGVLAIITFNIPILVVDIALIAVIGVFVTVSVISEQTMLQATVSDQFRGRVFASIGTTSALALLIGTGLSGALADTVGAVPMLDIAAVFVALGGVLALLLMPTGMVKLSPVETE